VASPDAEIKEDNEIEIGYLIGYLGIVFGLFVAPAQFIKLLGKPKRLYNLLIRFEGLFIKSSVGISVTMYLFLCLTLTCYLIHAVYIKSPVFIIAQLINIIVNLSIFIVLMRQGNGKS
jgi:hypothetical protein